MSYQRLGLQRACTNKNLVGAMQWNKKTLPGKTRQCLLLLVV
ncbi:hypothetical protein RNAN_1100 [Rheinheimera nanhaiensis E407-8]|uniref:Uncharacterized protein n=1 Tax=Rheinheimera nanhaiensis E407-8 TaxID=562729 RepID=I1DVQ1_9GAMM|nr:hypothetical protein RNAN_1100 [Rheinheimera nanhaiensis E407-8]